MSDQTQNMITKMVSLYTDELFQNHVSQVASKSILKEISNTDTLPEFNWSYVEPYLHRNASTLSLIVEEIALTDLSKLELIKNSAIRLALLWENLSRLKEATPRNTALINAAFSYELAGYQANASCLAKIFSSETDYEKSNLENLSSLFLQRLFIKLREECKELLKEPDHEMSKEEVIQKLGLAITASGFISCTNFFLIGSEINLTSAKAKFELAEKLFANNGNFKESNLLHSIQSLIDIMKSKSTWMILKNYRDSDFLWDRYIRLLARGLGNDIINSTSISELWPSQLESIKNGLLASNKSKIIRMPTSAGKTRIAEMAIVHTLISNSSSKCVYIAPYRALVSELEETFVSIFSDLGFRVSSILGYYENDPFESKMINDSDLLITTPEKLDLLLRSRPEFFKHVNLIILDESHVVSLQQRGIKIELLLSRLKKKFPKCRFLLLSAVLSEHTLNEFLDWFNMEQNDLIKLNWKPTIKQHAKFEWTKISDVGRLSYVSRPENELRKFFVNSIITHRKYVFKNPKTGKMNTKIFPSKEKNETAAELGFKYSQIGPVLIFTTEPRLVISVAKALDRRIDYSKKIGENLPNYFKNGESRSVKVAEEWLGKDNEITQLLKNGIGIHFGDLPDVLKRAIETDFRERNFQIIIATNTLAQGINFPIRTVVIHSCQRYIDGRRKRMSANEYWNLAGRAGRAGHETEGTVIHIIGSQSDEDDYNYYLEKQNELEPTNSALFNLLKDLTYDRISDYDLRNTIDPEILGILAEEASFDYYEKEIEDIITSSLVDKQAKKFPDLNTKTLSTAFRKVANDIVRSNPDKKILFTYSTTGLSSVSCRFIHNFVVDHSSIITNLLTTDDFQNVIPLTSLIFEALSELPEMIPRYSYGGDKIELLQLWISGKNLSEIVEMVDETNTSNITKFIEEFFGYYAPWGISSFLQIAMKVLDIKEEKIPNQIKFLPSMIKHGVPNPEASWAMQIGIPFKGVSIKMARKYVQNTVLSDYSNFVEWVSKIDSEDLNKEFRLQSPFLDDVSKTISRIAVNKFLKEKLNLSSVLEETTLVRGIQYENRINNVALVEIKDEIELVRDYQNLYDRNAIKFFFKGRELGFLGRHLAQYLAPTIDGGIKISGEVVSIKKLDIPKIEIKLKQKSEII